MPLYWLFPKFLWIIFLIVYITDPIEVSDIVFVFAQNNRQVTMLYFEKKWWIFPEIRKRKMLLFPFYFP